MTPAQPDSVASLTCPAPGRLRLALAVSALAHLALASALPQGTPLRHAAQRQADVPLTVRIVAMVSPVPEAPPAVHPDARRVTRAVRHASNVEQRASAATHATADALSGADVPALPRTPDPIYYAMRDLDRYPMPVTPLAIDRLASRAAGDPSSGFRIVVLIDEAGIVNDVAPAGFPALARVDPVLRAVLGSTRFHPALKDGRAVKSRVELVVDLGQTSP